MVFILTVTIIMVHYLNMLIAIMGNTFEVFNEVQEQIKYKSHLRFILDNWFLIKAAFPDRDKSNLVFSAFSVHDKAKDDDIYPYLVDLANQKLKLIMESN